MVAGRMTPRNRFVRLMTACAIALCAAAASLPAGASGTAAMAPPSPLDGLRLFLAPEQRIRTRTGGPSAPSAPSVPAVIEPAPVVAPPARDAGSTGTAGETGESGAYGRATVRGRRGVQRIERGVPRRAVDW